TVIAAAVIFIATLLAAQTATVAAVDVLMFGACANSVLVILQELRIWSPFVHAAIVSGHYQSVGFLGNTNYVGAYLAAPALAAIALTFIASGKRRWAYAAVAALLVAGLVLSASRTAVAALVAGVAVFVARTRRGAVALAIGIVVVALVSISPKTPLGLR